MCNDAASREKTFRKPPVHLFATRGSIHYTPWPSDGLLSPFLASELVSSEPYPHTLHIGCGRYLDRPTGTNPSLPIVANACHFFLIR